MNARVLTPTLIICGAAAVAGGIALARPPASPAAASAPSAVAPDPAAATASTAGPGSGYGRKATPSTTARRGAAPGGGAAKTTGATLTISGFAFGSPLTVTPGTKVSVHNADGATHTVTGDAFDTGTVAGGADASFTAPGAPGTYRFSCQIHPSMTGSLTVR